MSKALIVSANFYDDIASMLNQGASEALEAAGWTHDLYTVPGAFEIPAIVSKAIELDTYQAYIVLGCVIRGETSHYDYVCEQSARGLMDLATCFSLAIGYGILTVENHAQAVARAAVDQGNKGRAAVEAALSVAAFAPE